MPERGLGDAADRLVADGCVARQRPLEVGHTQAGVQGPHRFPFCGQVWWRQLAQVRREKEAAIEAKDLDGAAVLRDRERQLFADRARREREWLAAVDVAAVVEENRRLHDEVERLRGLLRQRGIEPDDGNSQTA